MIVRIYICVCPAVMSIKAQPNFGHISTLFLNIISTHVLVKIVSCTCHAAITMATAISPPAPNADPVITGMTNVFSERK